MSGARPFIICNPAAGSGVAAGRWLTFAAELRVRGVPFEFRQTARPGEASRLAAEAVAEGFSRIAVFGGDGTLHEVVQGLMSVEARRRSRVGLAFLAAGTSCDFDKSFPPTRSALERLTGTRLCPLDLIRLRCAAADGRVRVQYAVNASHLGVIAEATSTYRRGGCVVRMARRLGVNAAYTAAALAAIGRHGPMWGELSVDGGAASTLALSSLSVFKTPWVAGRMRMGGNVRRGDGTLGLLTFGASGRAALLRALVSLFSGGVERRGPAELRRCRAVTFAAPGAQVEADGELVGFTPVSYRIAPHALNVVV
ncbi:MAG TPA: diacylglycerol kinase family protein [Pyrinomonadaceae bacterium]|nr:diacylglycerol kinase family protein [Pyrinomonadaceae bacterium]